MNSYILAAGSQERWNEEALFPEYPVKQLIKIGEKTLIEDIQEKFPQAKVIFNSVAIGEKSKKKIFQKKAIPKAERILQVLKKEEILILLGDVYYSEEAVEMIKGATGVKFFGNNDEIFAAILDKTCLKALEEGAEKAKLSGKDKIWQVYYELSNEDLFVRIDDETQDFDRQVNYKDFLYKEKKKLKPVRIKEYEEAVTEELSKGAILNEEFEGFKEDYLVLHCLLRKYRPKRFLEVGTNMGTGTRIICNAIPEARVYSLDLPPEDAHKSLQHPVSEGKGYSTGKYCDLSFEQILYDSLEYDYSRIYPIDGWFIDAEHIYNNVLHESREAVKSKAEIIIWHDSDIGEVMLAIEDALLETNYIIYRVKNTRISYALRNSNNSI